MKTTTKIFLALAFCAILAGTCACESGYAAYADTYTDTLIYSRNVQGTLSWDTTSGDWTQYVVTESKCRYDSTVTDYIGEAEIITFHLVKSR